MMESMTCRWTEETGWVPPLAAGFVPDLVMYFAAPCLMVGETEVLSDFIGMFPGATVCGCSTAGEIFGDRVSDRSISAVLMRFDSVVVRAVSEEVTHKSQSADVGIRAGSRLPAEDLRHVMILSDGLLVNGTALLKGLRKTLPLGVSITGGLAGDGTSFSSTIVGLGPELKGGQVVLLGFYGERLVVGSSSQGGWVGFGPSRLITRSEGNTVAAIDGQPALELYKRYLGKRAAGLPASGMLFPLEVKSSLSGKDGLIRTIIAVDESKQSLTFAGEMPEGCYVRLMKASAEQLIAGAARAGAESGAVCPGGSVAIIISCVGRRFVLGHRSEEELEDVVSALPQGCRTLGFYSYGETCVGNAGDFSDLLNQNITITVIGEKLE